MLQVNTNKIALKVLSVPVKEKRSIPAFGDGWRKDLLSVSIQNGIQLIPISDIWYLKANSNYTEIYGSKGRILLSSKTLQRFEDKLSAFPFVRAHQSYLVHLSRIDWYEFGQQSKIYLHNGVSLPVSRSRKARLLSLLTF